MASRGRSVAALSCAPVLAHLLACGCDALVTAARARRFGVPFSGPSLLLHPVLGVHLSLVGTLAAAALAAAVAVWVARPPRWAGVAPAIALALVPCFGTLRDAVRWSQAPRTRPFALVPARRVQEAGASAVEVEGRLFELDRARAVEIDDARMRVQGGEVVVEVGAAHAADLARLSWESVKAVGENNGRGFVAIVVAGRPVAAAPFAFVATAARFAWPVGGLAAALTP